MERELQKMDRSVGWITYIFACVNRQRAYRAGGNGAEKREGVGERKSGRITMKD